MRAPGVEVRPLRQISGDAEYNEVFLTDVVVPDDCRIGDPGQGWIGGDDHAHERAAAPSGPWPPAPRWTACCAGCSTPGAAPTRADARPLGATASSGCGPSAQVVRVDGRTRPPAVAHEERLRRAGPGRHRRRASTWPARPAGLVDHYEQSQPTDVHPPRRRGRRRPPPRQVLPRLAVAHHRGGHDPREQERAGRARPRPPPRTQEPAHDRRRTPRPRGRGPGRVGLLTARPPRQPVPHRLVPGRVVRRPRPRRRPADQLLRQGARALALGRGRGARVRRRTASTSGPTWACGGTSRARSSCAPGTAGTGTGRGATP